MDADTLLWFCMIFNVILLLLSSIMIGKFNTVTKLSTLIYEQLSLPAISSPRPEDSYKPQDPLFERYPSSPPQMKAPSPVVAPTPGPSDPLLELRRASAFAALQRAPEPPVEELTKILDIPTKIATKAEAHLIKVLQSKFSNPEEESYPPVNK